MTKRVILAALIGGVCTAAGQTLLLRELLRLFSGYEPAAAALLCGWLLWAALGSYLGGRTAAPASRRTAPLLAMALLLAGAFAPGTLLLVRAAPPALELLGLPAGVRPSLDALAAVSLLVPGPFCFMAGAVFALCWRMARDAATPALHVYLAESIGAALGGGVAFAVLALTSRASASLALAFGLCGLCWAVGLRFVCTSRLRVRAFQALALALLCLALAFTPQLEHASMVWRWGPDAVASRDTPLQRLTMLQRKEQRSYFGGSGWLFTAPDPYHAEWAVHPALLAHAAPARVLLLGGDPFALPREACRQPVVEEVDFLEPDAGLTAFLQATLPEQLRRMPEGGCVRLLLGEPVDHLRRALAGGRRYDAILLNTGEPVNFRTSRLYSLEFLQLLRKLLEPEGVLYFAVPASPDALGPAQEALLRSLHATARAVFGHVEVVLGPQAMFFCSDAPVPLDLQTLGARLQCRGLELRHVREDTLQEILNPFRRGYTATILSTEGPLNRVLRPSACFESAMLWLQELQAGAWLRRSLQGLSPGLLDWLPWLAAALLALAFAVPRRPERAVPLAAALGGAGGLTLELAALFVFQALAGSLYSRLALLVGAWMTGLGLGAWLAQRSRRAGRRAMGGLFALQLLLCLVLAAAAPAANILAYLTTGTIGMPWTLLFTLFCLGGGMIGGAHFGLATRTGASKGATLYALDLAGAAAGSLLAGMLLVPVLGVDATLGLTACLLAGSCVGLWRGAAAFSR